MARGEGTGLPGTLIPESPAPTTSSVPPATSCCLLCLCLPGLWFVTHVACPSLLPGRVSFFTSGSENLHRVEKVHWGTRYAVTIAFSCNPGHGIADPAFT